MAELDVRDSCVWLLSDFVSFGSSWSPSPAWGIRAPPASLVALRELDRRPIPVPTVDTVTKITDDSHAISSWHAAEPRLLYPKAFLGRAVEGENWSGSGSCRTDRLRSSSRRTHIQGKRYSNKTRKRVQLVTSPKRLLFYISAMNTRVNDVRTFEVLFFGTRWPSLGSESFDRSRFIQRHTFRANFYTCDVISSISGDGAARRDIRNENYEIFRCFRVFYRVLRCQN